MRLIRPHPAIARHEGHPTRSRLAWALAVLLLIQCVPARAQSVDDATVADDNDIPVIELDLSWQNKEENTDDPRAFPGYRSLAGEWQFALERDLVEALGTDDPATISTARWPADVTRRLDVPGTFTTQIDGLRDFVGAGWYRVRVQQVERPGPWLGKIRFEGLSRRASVFVDGEFAPATPSNNGDHLMAWTPFDVVSPKWIDYTPVGRGDWTPEVQTIDIAVRVDNVIPEQGIPDREWDGWWNHAGIFRDVFFYNGLPYDPPVIRTLRRELDEGDVGGEQGGWTVLVYFPKETVRGIFERWADFNERVGREKPLYLSVTLTEDEGLGGRSWTEIARLREGRNGVTFSLPADLVGWSPDAPHLLTMEWDIRDSDQTYEMWESTAVGHYARGLERLGLRELQIDGSRVLLNGEPLKLLGASHHEIYIDTGYTTTRERLREALLDMKSLGMNFVRAAHYPTHPDLPELADEIGLIVAQEIPAWKTSAESLSSPEVWRDYAEPYLRGMVERDINRPSVCFWSVGNEFDTTDPRVCDYIERARNFVRSIDPTRPIIYASDRRLEDICLGSADVVGINEYYGWYYGEPSDLGIVLDELIARYPNKPILVTEFGAGCIAGLMEKPAGERRDYSEPAQAAFLEAHLRQMFAPERANHMLGATWWLYRDFDDPHRNERYHPKAWHGVNTKGLITREGVRKMSYDRFRALAIEFGFLDAEPASE